MKKQILVPVNFSEYSKIGLQSAIQIARNTDSEIILLHVIGEVMPMGINTTADITVSQAIQNERNKFMIELIRKKQLDLNDFLKSFDTKYLSLKTYVEVGDYMECLNTIVSENNVNLIVMGTSSETSLTEIYNGNHAEQTTRESIIPVLSIKSEQDFRNISTLGLFIDLENPNEKLISIVNEIKRFLHLDIVILHKKEMEFLEDSELITHLRLLAREYGIQPKAIYIMNGNNNISEMLRIAQKKFGINIFVKTVDKKSALARLFFEDATNELINEIREPVLLMSR